MRRVIVLCVILISAFVIKMLIDVYEHNSYVKTMKANGNKIINQLNSYKESYSQVPFDLNNIGIDTAISKTFIYEQISNTEFELLFSDGVGSGYNYGSKNKIWKYIN